MTMDSLDPWGDDAPRAKPTKVTIPDRPIEAGSYSWGWVDYTDYGPDGRPNGISVVMFDEPTDVRSMARLKRIASRPRWRSLLIAYGPFAFGFIALGVGNSAENPWLSQLMLILAALSGWNLWRYSRTMRMALQAKEVWGNRDLENYITGRAFLHALADPSLSKGDMFSYFELRARARELEAAISDTY